MSFPCILKAAISWEEHWNILSLVRVVFIIIISQYSSLIQIKGACSGRQLILAGFINVRGIAKTCMSWFIFERAPAPRQFEATSLRGFAQVLIIKFPAMSLCVAEASWGGRRHRLLFLVYFCQPTNIYLSATTTLCIGAVPSRRGALWSTTHFLCPPTSTINPILHLTSHFKDKAMWHFKPG